MVVYELKRDPTVSEGAKEDRKKDGEEEINTETIQETERRKQGRRKRNRGILKEREEETKHDGNKYRHK
jgi:hypothetical protein